MECVLTYTVLSGDNLSKIADQISASAGITSAQLEQANPDTPASAMQVGQLINVPECNSTQTWSYTICSGDTYSGIAAALGQCSGLTYEDIQQANNLTSTNIEVGELLKIPAVQSGSTSTLSPTAENMGYWDWTYESGSCPQNATIGIAFSGWTDVNSAITDSKKVINELYGTKFISFGGGNSNGSFSASALTDITNAISNGQLSDYGGIAYDIEEGDSGLSSYFATSFSEAKAQGFKVLVTVSHSAPYGISDADTLMASFFADDNIDFLSPQLYSTGEETANDYATTSGTTTTWADYSQAKAAVIPSIVKDSYYDSAQSYFSEQGVTLAGYIQWQQT